MESSGSSDTNFSVPDFLLSASKASRQVAGQIGPPVGSVWGRLSAHSFAPALSCEGLRLEVLLLRG